MVESSDYLAKNRAHWDANAPSYAIAGEREWSKEPSWGIWNVPEEDLGLLPRDMTGLDTIELGCGTAYVSAWLARRGARPLGIDNSPEQLNTARRLQAAHGLEFPLHLGNAEATPFPDASFDFAISEYGAAIWCDPHRWIPEAARILRPGGQLVFLGNSTLLMLTMPDAEDAAAEARLLRPQRGMHRFDWPDSIGVEFHVSPRRLDPDPPAQRLRDRGPDRGLSARRRDDRVSVRRPRMVAFVAMRGGLEGAQALTSGSPRP
jgi:SAM-dependent methyltransferase